MEDIIRAPVIAMPAVYLLPGVAHRWCKLQDACRAAHSMSRHIGSTFLPTPEELVRNFAALIPLSLDVEDGSGNRPLRRPKQKMFHFSKDGRGFWGTKVPIGLGNDCPPRGDFRLEAPYPYSEDLFVPEGWVAALMREISQGARAVGESEDGFVLGYRLESKGGDTYIIHSPE